MFQFYVSYYNVDKPNGKRSYPGFYSRYEDVLFSQLGLLDTMYKQVTRDYYDWIYFNNLVFVQIKNINTRICEYDVQIHDYYNPSKKLADYRVEIECMNPPVKKEEEELLFEQFFEIGKFYKVPSRRKKRQYTSWLLKESREVIYFITMLYDLGSLNKVKDEMPKSSYYRYLKTCKEKGFINEKGKITRRVYVTKYVDND